MSEKKAEAGEVHFTALTAKEAAIADDVNVDISALADVDVNVNPTDVGPGWRGITYPALSEAPFFNVVFQDGERHPEDAPNGVEVHLALRFCAAGLPAGCYDEEAARRAVGHIAAASAILIAAQRDAWAAAGLGVGSEGSAEE